jgi:hypothetical protein
VESGGGFVLGLVFRTLAFAPGPEKAGSSAARLWPFVILIGAPIVAAIWGVSDVRRAEAAAQPRVLYTNGQVERLVTSPGPATDGERGRMTFDRFASPSPDAAKGLPAFDRSTGSFVRGERGSPAVDLTPLNYVTSVYLIGVGPESPSQWSVAVINGRGTGRRSMVVVLDGDLGVAHSELVGHAWQLHENPLAASSDAVFVGNPGKAGIVLRLKRPGARDQPTGWSSSHTAPSA